MSKLREFVQTSDRVAVFVNPDAVRLVRPNHYSEGVDIVFDAEHSITVQGDIGDVVMSLNGPK